MHDLHAIDAVYHQTCSVNFRTKKQMPMSQCILGDSKRPKLGRPQNDMGAEEIAGYLEDDDEQIDLMN